MDKDQILLEEWKEVRTSLRYFGNKRFAQLTVFIAASGLMISAFLGEYDPQSLIMLRIMGMILSILFFILEISSVRYWKTFVRRGEEIEDQINGLKLMKYRPKLSGLKKMLSGTWATYMLYGLTLIFWVSSFVWK